MVTVVMGLWVIQILCLVFTKVDRDLVSIIRIEPKSSFVMDLYCLFEGDQAIYIDQWHIGW